MHSKSGEKFEALRAALLRHQELKISFLHQALGGLVEKSIRGPDCIRLQRAVVCPLLPKYIIKMRPKENL